MSVLYKYKNICLIDHQTFISNIYANVHESSNQLNTNNFKLKSCLFSIKKTAKTHRERKRKQKTNVLIDEAAKVRDMYNKLLLNLPKQEASKLAEYCLMDTESVRKMAQQMFEAIVFDYNGLSGGNNSDIPLKCSIRGEDYVLPEHSRFLCGCVKDQCKKLAGIKYNILVADPPWWNKFIRRLKSANEKLSYSMMYNEDVASIPVRALLADGCVVAVWCTNAPSHVSAVKDMIFPAWGVEYVTTWYWLKVTAHLEPLCDFAAGSRKQPYERLMLGRAARPVHPDIPADIPDRSSGPDCLDHPDIPAAGPDSRDHPVIPEDLLLVSVPSALHSHKPPLLDLLTPLCRGAPQVLELFARYLLPRTTAVGYEPLKWQHVSLYESSVASERVAREVTKPSAATDEVTKPSVATEEVAREVTKSNVAMKDVDREVTKPSVATEEVPSS